MIYSNTNPNFCSAEAEEASEYVSAQIRSVDNKLRKSTELLSLGFGIDEGGNDDDDEPDIAGSPNDTAFKRIEKRIADMWSGGDWEGVEYKVFMQLVIREDPDFTRHVSPGDSLSPIVKSKVLCKWLFVNASMPSRADSLNFAALALRLN